jgi:Spy/CpxP family protein refolding chaperone
MYMKGQLTVLVIAAMLFGVSVVCQAMPGGDNPGPGGCAEGQSPPGSFPARLARILELSEAQKAKIQAIFEEERGKAQALRQKGAELRRQLQLAERAASFDEQAVQSKAGTLAGIEAELIVAHIKTRHRVNSVLTAAQRSLAEKLAPEREERPGPPCGGGPEGRRHHGPDADDDWR